MTKAQKAVGMVVASGIIILTYTSYNATSKKVFVSGTSNSMLQGKTNTKQTDDTTRYYDAAQNKYTPGYNNPIND